MVKAYKAGNVVDQQAEEQSEEGDTASSMTVGVKLLELLGVPTQNVTKARINIEGDAPIMVEVEYLARGPKEGVEGVEFEVREYELVDKTNPNSDLKFPL